MGSSTGSRFGKLEPKTKMNLAQVLIQIEIIYPGIKSIIPIHKQITKWFVFGTFYNRLYLTRICIISGLEYLQAAACIS